MALLNLVVIPKKEKKGTVILKKKKKKKKKKKEKEEEEEKKQVFEGQCTLLDDLNQENKEIETGGRGDELVKVFNGLQILLNLL